MSGSLKSHKLYGVWSSMKQRCLNPNCKDYPYYGGKGIAIAEEWNNYSVFMSWCLKNGWAVGLELERNDSTKNYCPSNCSFVDRFIQNQNKGIYKNNKTGFAGIGIMKDGKYRVRLQAFKQSFYLGLFSNIKEAIAIRDNFIIEKGFLHILNKGIENGK